MTDFLEIESFNFFFNRKQENPIGLVPISKIRVFASAFLSVDNGYAKIEINTVINITPKEINANFFLKKRFQNREVYFFCII